MIVFALLSGPIRIDFLAEPITRTKERGAICYDALSETRLDRQAEKLMKIHRKTDRDDHEIILQYPVRQETLVVHEDVEQKLTQLRSFIWRLEQTPSGAAEIRRRVELFGECKRSESENSGQFYARLRYWLDKDLPQTKSPLHAPRQTDD